MAVKNLPSGINRFSSSVIAWSSALLSLAAGFSGPVHAQLDTIMVTPTRVSLEPGQRAAEVYVVNRSDGPLTARISLVNRRMSEDGSLVDASEPLAGEHFADSLLQYAPRRVHLGANQGQTVRILAQPPAGPPTEYRSHLLFRVEPTLARDSSRDAPGESQDENLQVRLIPVYGVTIPVIVRTGELSVSSSITDISLQRGDAHQGGPVSASFMLRRIGDGSVYGDIHVYYQPSVGGPERLVGQARGLAVYPPLPARHVVVPLDLEGESLRGRIRVQYVDHANKDSVLAEAENAVP